MELNDILFRYLTVSVITGFLILLLCIATPYINKTYTAKTKYYIWLIIAIYLIIPIEIPLWEEPVKVAVSNTVTIYNNMAGEGNEIIWSGTQSEAQNGAQDEPQDGPQSEAQSHAFGKAQEADTSIPKGNMESRTIWISEILILIWGAGFFVFVCYELLKYQLYKKHIYRWSKIPKRGLVTAKVEAVSKEIGIKQKIPVLICEKTGSPMMTGLLHPCIFLPHEDFEEQDLSFIIRHELTHYKRKDLWYKALLLAARAIHWFNPFVYMMCKYANTDIERSCDDYLLTGKPYEYRKSYSEAIFATIKHQKMNYLSTYFYGGISIMKERFKNILNMKAKKRGRALCLFIAVCIVGANGLIGCGMVDINSSQDEHMSSYYERRTEKSEGELSMYKLVLSPSESTEKKIWKSEDDKYNIFMNSTDGEYDGAVVSINDIEYSFSYAGYAPVAEEPEFAVYDVNKDGVDDFLFRGEAYRTELRQDVYLSAQDGNYIELGDVTWNNLNPEMNTFSFEAKYADDYHIHVVSGEWGIDEVVPIQAPSWLDIVYEEGIYDKKGKVHNTGSELLLKELQGQSVKYIKNDSEEIELVYNAQIAAGYSEYCLGWSFSFVYGISNEGYELKSVSLIEFPYD